jgi:hypothetical protein
MKKIIIRKDRYFSSRSKIFLHAGSVKTCLKGYNPYIINLNEGDKLYATYMWTGSNEVDYEDLDENIPLLIRPRIRRSLIAVFLIVYLICVAVFIRTRWRLSVLPLLPFGVYIGAYITVLRNGFMVREKDQN